MGTASGIFPNFHPGQFVNQNSGQFQAIQPQQQTSVPQQSGTQQQSTLNQQGSQQAVTQQPGTVQQSASNQPQTSGNQQSGTKSQHCMLVNLIYYLKPCNYLLTVIR